MVPERVYAREIDTLIQIQRAGLSRRIRITQLNGLVTSTKDNLIYGLLLDAINNHDTLWTRHNDPIALRKRWYNDVADMIRQLHAADIAWGDFKPAKMLSDENDTVWLIDFGGRITKNIKIASASCVFSTPLSTTLYPHSLLNRSLTRTR